MSGLSAALLKGDFAYWPLAASGVAYRGNMATRTISISGSATGTIKASGIKYCIVSNRKKRTKLSKSARKGKH